MEVKDGVGGGDRAYCVPVATVSPVGVGDIAVARKSWKLSLWNRNLLTSPSSSTILPTIPSTGYCLSIPGPASKLLGKAPLLTIWSTALLRQDAIVARSAAGSRK